MSEQQSAEFDAGRYTCPECGTPVLTIEPKHPQSAVARMWPCGHEINLGRLTERPWRVDLSCCGRHFDTQFFVDWQNAHDFREAYCTGAGVDPNGYGGDGRSGHQRAGIITDARVTPSERTTP